MMTKSPLEPESLQISQRSSSVTSEVKKQTGNMSLMRGERLGANQWAEAAVKAVSVIKSASVAGTEDEQMTRGRMLVSSAVSLSLSSR